MEAFPNTKPAVGGFPDSGDGRYSRELTYKTWVEFNNAMRVHMNFVEGLPLILTIICISGLFLPKATVWIAFIFAIARIFYSIMYATCGANSRLVASVTGNFPLYCLMIAAFVMSFIELSKT